MSRGAPRLDGTMLLSLRENASDVQHRQRYQMLMAVVDAMSGHVSKEYFLAFDETEDRALADFAVNENRIASLELNQSRKQ